MINRAIITILYGKSWLFGIGTTLESGCVRSAGLHNQTSPYINLFIAQNYFWRPLEEKKEKEKKTTA